jgi:nucleoside-diphosphate-sugar epimerase
LFEEKMILVTGITGKSGNWFLRRLIDESEKVKGYKFRVIVRNNSDLKLIEGSNLSIEKVFGDLYDDSFVEKSMRDISTVLHIAGIQTSLNVVKAALKNNVKRLILVHTTGIYSKYKSASAEYIEIERQIADLISNRNVDITILRPTMIYGRASDRNVIVFIKMVDKLRFFPVINHARYFLQPVYEKDLGDAYFEVLISASVTRNKNYILSGKEPILLIDMLKIIGEYLEKKNTFISIPFSIAYIGVFGLYILTFGNVDYREKVKRLVEPRVFDHTEASVDFGYSPISFREGVEAEIAEYKLQKNRSR